MERISTASAQNRTTQTLVFGTIDHAIYCGWKCTLICCPAAILRNASSTNCSCKGGCLKSRILPPPSKQKLLKIMEFSNFRKSVHNCILANPQILRHLHLLPMICSRLLATKTFRWFQAASSGTTFAKWLGQRALTR